MTRGYKEALISYRLEKARESSDAAQLLLNNGMLTSSMNRGHLNVFPVVNSLPQFEGLIDRSTNLFVDYSLFDESPVEITQYSTMFR
jgi:hypothetical protein